jgi:hypothetical protein
VSAAKKKAAAPIRPRHCVSAQAFGAWLDEHHASAEEQWVRFWKKGSGKPSIDWPQSVREAAAAQGQRMERDQHPHLARADRRRPHATGRPARVRGPPRAPQERLQLRVADRSKRAPACALCQVAARQRSGMDLLASATPSFKRKVVHWMTSAKRDEKRAARLERLIAACAAGRRIGD